MMRSTAVFIVSSCVCVMFVSVSWQQTPKCSINWAARHMTCRDAPPEHVQPLISSVTIEHWSYLLDKKSRFYKYWYLGLNRVSIARIEWPTVTRVLFENSDFVAKYHRFRLANKRTSCLVIKECRLFDSVNIYGDENYTFGKTILQDSMLFHLTTTKDYDTRITLQTSTLLMRNVTCPVYSNQVVLWARHCRSISFINVTCTIRLDQSNSYYRYLNFTASEKTVTEFLRGFTDDSERMSQLTSLDISGGYLPLVKIPATQIDQNRTAFFPVLREFYARNVIPVLCTLYVQTYYFMSCIQVSYSEAFDHSFIGCFNPTTVTSVDLAKNRIKSLGASFFKTFIALQVLDISSNYLNTVNGGSDLDFKRMTSLKEIYVANNHIRSLAADIFDNLYNLTIIDLSNNKLDSIVFRIDHLLKLQSLRVDANNIKFIDSSSLTQISSLISYQNVSANRSFQLNLSENPMTCSCSIKPFITWVLHNKPTMKVWPLYCHLTGKVKRIDASALRISSELCHWPTYVIISCILSTISVSIVIASAVYCFLRWRNSCKEKRIRKLIDNFNNVNDRQLFPVFLSFCSNNADFVMANVFDELNNRLQDLLGTRQRCVAFGDADFRPGFIVIEEMTRCLSVCDVVVLCVSNTFLKSPWCADETRIAHYLRKPVVLMFLEEVDKKQLEKSIVLLYFLTSCRAKWILKTDGSYELQPGWGTVCEAVITLLSETRGDHSEEETAV